MSEFNPLVSIRLMTYNHEPFIRQAMDGIMMQETDFCVEVVVGDDFSSDNTLEIIKSYESTENIKINILDRAVGDNYWTKRQELGRIYNFTNIIENCTGKYIALLDGDDYWTNPHKLQIQIDILESNTEITICGHHCLVNSQGKEDEVPLNSLRSKNFNEVLLHGLGAETLSVVFRNFNIEFPNWIYNCEIADYPLFLLLLYPNGLVKYLNETMGCYRIHGNSVWSSLTYNQMGEKGINTFKVVDQAFEYKYHKLIDKAIKLRKRKFGMVDYSFIAVFRGETPIKYLILHFYHKFVQFIKVKFGLG